MLQINNLHATVADKPILKGLTLSLNAGEIHAIMGPNGAGKSTLAYVLSGRPGYEATTSKISDDQMFYAMQRGLNAEEAVALIVNGFAKEVLQQLPMEFAVEAQKLLGISLEGSVG
jgi:Fe-S cluster assembly ATPase SufC